MPKQDTLSLLLGKLKFSQHFDWTTGAGIIQFSSFLSLTIMSIVCCSLYLHIHDLCTFLRSEICIFIFLIDMSNNCDIIVSSNMPMVYSNIARVAGSIVMLPRHTYQTSNSKEDPVVSIPELCNAILNTCQMPSRFYIIPSNVNKSQIHVN